MKRNIRVAVLFLSLLAPPMAMATTPSLFGMMNGMWYLMEWFMAREVPLSGGYGGPYGYRDTLPWSAPVYPAIPVVLDGAWVTPSGEYWVVRGNRFSLVTRDGRRFEGGFRREGPFIYIRLPHRAMEFTYRFGAGLLWLQDVSGKTVMLRRVRHPGWNW